MFGHHIELSVESLRLKQCLIIIYYYILLLLFFELLYDAPISFRRVISDLVVSFLFYFSPYSVYLQLSASYILECHTEYHLNCLSEVLPIE